MFQCNVWIKGRNGLNLTVFVVYTFLTLVLTYPVVFNLTTAVPNDIGDPLLNTWILAWVSHAWLTDPLNLFNANIFYPLPNTLAYSEHLVSTAMLVFPLQLFFGEPILAYNVSLLATFPLAAFGMYLLVLHWTRHRQAAFVAGVIFAFNPYRFATIAHLQLLTFQWLPYIVLFLDLLLEEQGYKKSTKGCLILFVVLQFLASWYLAIYTALIGGIYLLVRLLAQAVSLREISWQKLFPLIATLLISSGLILPFAWPYLSLVDNLRQARPLSQALELATTPTDFMAAAPFNRLFGSVTESLRQRPHFTEENNLFLGFVAPILAFFSLFYGLRSSYLRPKFYALLIILLLTLSLTFAMPYTTLARLIPPATIVRVPPRWIIPTLFALAGLASLRVGETANERECETANERECETANERECEIANEQNFKSSIRLFAYSPIRLFAYSPIRPFAYSPIRLFAYSPIRLFAYSPIRPFAHSPIRPFAYSPIRPFALILLLIVESFSAPIPLATVDNHLTLNSAYHWLAKNQSLGETVRVQDGETPTRPLAHSPIRPFALLELPMHSAPFPEYPEVKRMYASTLGWWHLVNGYSGYTPPRQPHLAQAVANFPTESAITTLQSLAKPIPLFLLIHPGESPFNRSHWEDVLRWQTERNPSLFPIGQFNGDYLYQVMPTDSNRFSQPPRAIWDDNIRLLSYQILSPRKIILYWQTTAPISTDYTIFIHLCAADGFVRDQADSPPVSNHYPTTKWQIGEVIQDIHALPPTEFDHLTIGLYDPITGKRLSVVGLNGLANDAMIIQ